MIDRFLTWWHDRLEANFLALGIVLWLQVPHMIWVWVDPVLHAHGFGLPHDAVLASIDLLEVPAILAWTLSAVALARERLRRARQGTPVPEE